MPKCKISEVITLSQHRKNPILAHFQNGQILPEGANAMDCTLATDTRNNKQIAVAISADCVYSGTINEGFPDDLLRTFIGIRNKTTNKIRLIEVNQCSMLSHHYEQKEEVPQIRTAADSLKILLTDFGGKKANRLLDKQQRTELNMDVVQDQLNRTVEDVKRYNESQANIEDEFDKRKMEQEKYLKSMIPPVNQNAITLNQVYSVADLIDPILFDRMDEEAHEMLKTSISDIPIEATFLKNIISNVQHSNEPDSKDRIDKIKICIYVDALICFLKGLNKNLNMKATAFSKITEKVETDIRRKFTQPDGIKLIKTNYTVHKVICHIVVLSILVSDKYQIEISNFVEETNTSKSKLKEIINVLPIRLSAGTSILALKLPSQIKTNKPFFGRRKK